MAGKLSAGAVRSTLILCVGSGEVGVLVCHPLDEFANRRIGEEKHKAALKLFEEIARAWHAKRVEGLDPAEALRVINRLERDLLLAGSTRLSGSSRPLPTRRAIVGHCAHFDPSLTRGSRRFPLGWHMSCAILAVAGGTNAN